MEIELQKSRLEFYEKAAELSFEQDASCEMIVPDAQPDILRLIDTAGTVLIRSRECGNGCVTVTGLVNTVVLYVPDGAEGIRRLELSVPFSASVDSAEVSAESFAVVSGALTGLDAAMVNPRKITVSAKILLCAECLKRRELSVSTGCENAENIELKTASASFRAVTAVREKSFVIEDSFTLPPSEPPIAELLAVRAEISADEIKSVGSKALFKGSIYYELLYLPEDGGETCRTEMTTPYSQIMETEESEGESSLSVTLFLSGAYFAVEERSGDGRTVNAELHAVSQLTAAKNVEISCVEDLYSTVHPLSFETEEHAFCVSLPEMTARETFRDTLRTSDSVSRILDFSILPGLPRTEADGNRLSLAMDVSVRVMFLDENGDPSTASHTFTVKSSAELPDGAAYRVSGKVLREASAVPDGGEIELRIPVEFCVSLFRNSSLKFVKTVTLNEEESIDLSGRPSVVVYRTKAGDSLWSLARKYCSGAALISEANELGDESELKAGTLLLIPKKR